jgi:phosphoglycolate phosphatase
MIKNFIFDLDGTLIDSAPSIKKHLFAALRENGLDFNEYAAIKIGPPLPLLIESIVGHIPKTSVDKIMSDYRRVYSIACLTDTFPYKGIPEILTHLKNKNLNSFIATFKSAISSKPISELLFDGLYKDLMTPESIENFKNEATKADLLKALMEKHKLCAKECAMIGDSKTDIDGGKEVGMTTIACLYGYGQEGEFEAADFKVGNVLELGETIFGLQTGSRD